MALRLVHDHLLPLDVERYGKEIRKQVVEVNSRVSRLKQVISSLRYDDEDFIDWLDFKNFNISHGELRSRLQFWILFFRQDLKQILLTASQWNLFIQQSFLSLLTLCLWMTCIFISCLCLTSVQMLVLQVKHCFLFFKHMVSVAPHRLRIWIKICLGLCLWNGWTVHMATMVVRTVISRQPLKTAIWKIRRCAASSTTAS